MSVIDSCDDRYEYEYKQGYKQGQTDAVERVADLVRCFVKEWNKENCKRISYVASDELISYIRVRIKEQRND